MKKTFKLLAILVLLTGCQTTRHYQNSSAIEFLYPDTQHQKVVQQVPKLTLPLRVGVAFTPGGNEQNSGLTEVAKEQLLANVAKNFNGLDFVKSIQVIPSAYLRPGGSFENLDQIKRMFDIDVIALVSYDQVHFTGEGLSSIAYWTLIGAYIIKGEKNSTQTMLDAVVYDIDSRKMLFRAPGLSTIKSSATPVNWREQTRKDSVKGFDEASADLIKNLKVQLQLFQDRVKTSPSDFQIAKSKDYKGSGYGGILLLLTALALWTDRRRQIS